MSADPFAEYLAGLPDDRREALNQVIGVIRANIQPGFEERIIYKMPGWVVPFETYPWGYHCDPKLPLGAINVASTKGHMALHLFCMYGDGELKKWFEQKYEESGKKRDIGAGCVRFKKLDDLPLDVVGELVRKVTVDGFIRSYESALKPEVLQKHKKRKPASA
ncbi:MAG: DUF1801 domain-containing protein [Armatimonadetes bacterium]|nr:DUF1801 domain-containing protein [Armatimonadota bacterium]